MQDLILKLFDIGAVKFGSFTLKNGAISPIYLDLRLIVSYPRLLQEVADAMWEKIKTLKMDIICGVPYTALPIATVISITHGTPMVMRRKEVKDYGTRRIIEGVYNYGQRCVVIEDLVTTGSSIFETIDPLEQEGLKVKDVVVLIDREQGGKERLENCGYHLHSVFSLSVMLQTLKVNKKITRETMSEVTEYLNPRSGQ